MEKQFIIKGTHCHSCKVLIEDVLGEISGVHSSEVNVKTGETKISHDGSLDWTLVKEEIEKLGDYRVEGI